MKGGIPLYIKNRIVSLIYRLTLLAVIGTGLSVNFGLIYGRFNTWAFIFYTNLSNLICFLYFTALAIRTIRGLINGGADAERTRAAFLPRLKGAFTMMITVTFIIYHFVLAGGKFQGYTGDGFMFWLSDFFLHYIAPLLVISDWLMFSPKHAFRWQDPLLWTAIPFVYLVAMFIRAETGGTLAGFGTRFPYFFMDIDAIGWTGVLGYTAIIALAYIILGYVMVIIDRLIPFSRHT
jgi:hypothetical protein